MEEIKFQIICLSWSISLQYLVMTVFSWVLVLRAACITFSFRMAHTCSIGQTSAILGACLSWGILLGKAEQAWRASGVLWILAGSSCQYHLILTDSVLLAFSFFIISPFKFHQIRHPGTVLNAELHEVFKTGITFKI